MPCPPLTQGGTHVCAIREKRLLCWGMNSSGQLGCGDTCADLPESTGLGAGVDGPYSAVPLEVAGGLRWSQVAPAVYFTCGVTTDRTAMCCERFALLAPAGRGLEQPQEQEARQGCPLNPSSGHRLHNSVRSCCPVPPQGDLATSARRR